MLWWLWQCGARVADSSVIPEEGGEQDHNTQAECVRDFLGRCCSLEDEAEPAQVTEDFSLQASVNGMSWYKRLAGDTGASSRRSAEAGGHELGEEGLKEAQHNPG